MRPQDVDKIASAVVASLAGGQDTGLLGCGGYSDTTSFNASPGFVCPQYVCGGQADFGCWEGFDCTGFTCPLPAAFTCLKDGFDCSTAPGAFYAMPCTQFDVGT